MPDVRLMTYAPGHFHAALVQKEMYPGVSPRVHVYAPLDADLIAHLDRIAAFNNRRESPTAWEVEVHAGPDAPRRMTAERPGNVVVIAGRNRPKIDAILESLRAGLHVLADKPWIIRSEDLPLLEEALDLADRKRLVALDVMTERWEVTTRLQLELISDPDVFGELAPGSEDAPAVSFESEHFLLKSVAGVPLRRPAWWFDVEEAGEALADVGTHLVDLMPWLLFHGQPIRIGDIELSIASRWPTTLSRADFRRVTGEPDFPASLASQVRGDVLHYHGNNSLSYTLRGAHVRLSVLWGFEPGPGQGDRHLARVVGTRSVIEVRQGEAERHRPEVYVIPRRAADLPTIRTAVSCWLEASQLVFPGVGFAEIDGRLKLTIPERLRAGHEAHFAELTRLFLSYLDHPARLPAWEKANMLAKYHVTTRGVELARRGGATHSSGTTGTS